MKGIYEFFWDCGRQGDLQGLFIADDSEVAEAIDTEVYFGEALGKHSEIYGTFEERDVKLVTQDQEFIQKLQEILKVSTTISGYNPLEYLSEED